MFVAPQINAQDIDYQEQLGHGNGGTVYKWVFTGTNITRPQHNNGYWPYIYTIHWKYWGRMSQLVASFRLMCYTILDFSYLFCSFHMAHASLSRVLWRALDYSPHFLCSFICPFISAFSATSIRLVVPAFIYSGLKVGNIYNIDLGL